MQQYIVFAWDGTDTSALDRRMASRPAHLEGAGKLKANGNYVVGGAMLDDDGKMIGSTMIVQFPSKEDLQRWLDSEPYVNGKVWEKIDVRPFRVANV